MRTQAFRNEMFDLLMTALCESENLEFCADCPQAYTEEDTGARDCPYGSDICGCEYSPYEVVNDVVEELIAQISDVMPG